MYNVFDALHSNYYEFTDVVINLTPNKEYGVDNKNFLHYSRTWRDSVSSGINDVLDFVGLRSGVIGFGKAIVSLGMDVKEDVGHLYDDDFIFCPIKGGLKVTVIGNGAKIYVKNPSDNDMNHLFHVSSGSTLFLDNVIVSGFNSAVINYGQLNFNQSRFTDNKINYVISDKDIGGAIRNFGVASFINCTFNDNYANKGAAIYNEGVVKSLDCNYNNNLASLSSKASDRTLGIEHIPIVSTIGNFFNNLGSAVRLFLMQIIIMIFTLIKMGLLMFLDQVFLLFVRKVVLLLNVILQNQLFKI